MSPKKSLLIAALGLAIALAVLIVTRSSFGVRAQDVP